MKKETDIPSTRVQASLAYLEQQKSHGPQCSIDWWKVHFSRPVSLD